MNIAEVKDGVLHLTAVPGTECCDFCSSPEIVKDYDCEDFTIEFHGVKNSSGGKWAACSDCARLIDSGDREGLTQRSYEKFRHAEKDESTLGFLKMLHGEFWRLRKNPDEQKYN